MKNVLEISNLKKGFASPEGFSLVLDVPKFLVQEGEQVALIGQSGTGKTTFLHILAGILTADEGSVLLDGQDLGQLSESRRDRLRGASLGYIFQTFNLLQGYSALENVEMAMYLGSQVDRARARHLLARVGLSERENYRPRQLSVGQQQRVAVARSLANRPKLVLADEPTGNLDPQRAQEVLTLISEICREVGAALLLVTHDPLVLERFARVERLGELNQVKN